MAIKILIADDHALLRQGIKKVLNFEEDLEVIGEAEDGQDALAKTMVLQPDILLLDLNMPILSGLDVTRQLQMAKVKTKIIVLTIHDSDNYVIELLKSGADGYLLKDVEPSMLIKAIHVVYAGNAFVYPKLEEKLFGDLNSDDDVNEKAREMWRQFRPERLTTREMDVLRCIARGFNNQEISQALFVSEKTVKNHLTNIFRKINVNDRTQALIYVLKNKIMTLD
ncbi:two component transcriptional regulator, LuxR family [Propionispira arboris]|jgi:DNA-binding NarL/FixJ family response regulator|uniref:Two component transcriptional regulator, LuxR family n=1 Tax=Propionispira arboris TaxID=84035 RepID=A0A1H6U8C9_9FIRM|nr:response regulator transcription factor [Propionispira arboris]SEI86844.1 two component transcriptional regulator, LuxR family [Propionispira arboris]